MYDTNQTDVLIIGGGPAGAAAARFLAGWGHEVVLLTRRPSALGELAESLPPSSRKLFDLLGATERIDRAGFIRTTGNTVWWGGEERTAVFASGERGYQVNRSQFDEVLVELAENAGARVDANATVREVSAATGGPGGWRVRYDTAEGTQETIARWVLDCSGRAGVVARRGWREPASRGRTLALVASWDRIGGWGLSDETHTLVESYEAGWAWSVPTSPTRRCIAVMVDPALTPVGGRAELAALYRAELGRTNRLGELIERATLAGDPWACDASTYGAQRVSDDGVLLVGDAASFVDPLSSFGVKKALASAWLAAVVTHTCLSEPEVQGPALQLYESRERLMYESMQRRSAEFSRLAADRHANDFWIERAATDGVEVTGEPDVAALRRDPDVLGAFEALRRAESIDLRQTKGMQRVELPIVRGNRVALAPHLVSPAFPHGIRYVRDVDLVQLAELASGFRHVPDLYEAYNRAAPPAALPDFLGALSTLIAKGILEYA